MRKLSHWPNLDGLEQPQCIPGVLSVSLEVCPSFTIFRKLRLNTTLFMSLARADWARAKILISWRTIKSNQTQIGHNCATHRHLFTQTTHSHRFIWRDSYKFMYKVSYHIMMWLLMWWNGNLTFRCQINADFSAITEQPPNPASCFQQ